jgi:hypothetical protein
VMLAGIVIAVGNVAAAGAASSLIFLIAFAIVHWAAVLANRRSAEERSVVLPRRSLSHRVRPRRQPRRRVGGGDGPGSRAAARS